MGKTIKIVLSIAVIVSSFALAKKPDVPLMDRPIDNKVQVLIPGTNQQVPLNILEERYLAPRQTLDSDIVPLDKIKSSQTTVSEGMRNDLWDLKHVDDVAEWYLGSGDADDTMAVAFVPAAPCIVREVYYQWFDAGNVVAWGAMLSDDGIANTVNGASTLWPRGNASWSPIGEWMTPPTPNTVEEVSDWSAELNIGIVGDEFIVGDSTNLSVVETFLIIFVKGGESPHPLASDVTGDTYLWFGGPWMGADCGNGNGDWGDGWCWGSYQTQSSMDNGLIDNMCLVKVEYPWGAPIAVQSMNQLCNTYSTGKTETIFVDLFDDVDEETGMAIDENDVVTAHYIFQGDTTDLSLTPYDVGAEGNGIYTFDITYSGAVVGDVIEYWVTCLDNDDLASEGIHLTFEIKEPSNPDANLLVLRDRVSSRQRDLVEQVLDDYNYVYEIWDTFNENGIDNSVIDHGWTNIVAYGWGNMTIPVIATEDDPGYADFIDGGGNLMLIDMDWFYGHGLDPEITFAEGDFAYDYFGLAAGVNDPGPDDTVSVYGEGVTPIDNPFTVDPLVLRHAPYLLTGDAGWIDYLTAGTATDMFYDDLGHLVGTVLDHEVDGGGKAVYLAFMADAAGDTLVGGEWDYTQFAELMDGVIAYFNILSPPVVDLVGEGSTRYGVASGTNSATINATAFDADGALTAVTLKWSVDNGAENSQAMTLVTGDAYSATITLDGFVDTSAVVYWVETTDDDNLTTVSSTGAFWGTSFVPSGVPVLYMFDYYAPYAGYGPADADTITQANMTAIGMNYDVWDVWYNGQADFATVLSNYGAVIYAGVLDWISMPENSADHTLTEFVDNGGYMLFSSEEVLGTYTEWEDVTFPEGHFVYDVLGVEWVANDYNYVEVLADDDGGTGLIDGLPTEDIPLDASFMVATGYMNDLCDPLYYGTENQLPSPFLADYSGVGNYYYASSINGTVAFIAFNLSMIPDAEQQQLLENFKNWYSGEVVVTQDIALTTGWNIFSGFVTPEDVDMLSVVQPLIDADALDKVIDEAGNTIIFYFGEWVNNIGDFASTEGYYIKVSADADLSITGTPVALPFDIDLASGWNIMGYPTETAQDAIDVVQPLIDAEELDKVIDEAGNTIIFFFGEWVNNIGDFAAGEGYYIKVSAATSLTISAPALASSETQDRIAKTVQTHFTTCWADYTNPYMPMNFWVIGVEGAGFAVGDEVALFDGDLCVGAGIVESVPLSISNSVNIIASMDDGIGQPGFTAGDSITIKTWDESGDNEIVVSSGVVWFDPSTGLEIDVPTFEALAMWAFTVPEGTVGIDDEPGLPEVFALRQNYPNPFNPVTAIKFDLAEASDVNLVIYDLLGHEIATLVNDRLNAGYHNVVWNGTDRFGKLVSTGMYIYRITAGDFTSSKKMVLLK